jgi:hypothetical protein
MRRLLLLLGLVLIFICPILPGQQTLNNDAVLKQAHAGLSDDQLINAIKASPGNYDISMYALDVLRKGGISENVIAAIVEKASGFRARTKPSSGTAVSAKSPARTGSGKAASAVPASPTTGPGGLPDGNSDAGLHSTVPKASGADARTTPSTGSDATPGSAGSGGASSPATIAPLTGSNGLPIGISDVGVYYRDKNGAWIPMLPEIVNFQSTGKLRNIASAGILKGDLEGRIEGTRARVDATLPVVFAVYLPAGVEITGYMLLELHPTPIGRTFLSAEGGVLHTQAGAQRDEIDFLPEKLAPRLYQITLPAIEGKGEYGLLAPGPRSTPNKETSGRIYTVSVAE